MKGIDIDTWTIHDVETSNNERKKERKKESIKTK